MILILQQAFICLAQTQQDIAAMTAARAHGERIANIGQNQVTSVLTQNEALNQMKKLAGYDEQKAAEIKGRGVELGNSPTLGNDAKEKSPIFSQSVASAREALLDDKYGFRKGTDKFAVDNKGYLDTAKQKIKDAPGSFDFIRGKYKNYEHRDEVSKYQSEEVCDEYYDVKVSGCTANQIVEIDPKYTYQCSKKREEKQKVCSEIIEKIKCKKTEECDNGGIEPNTISSRIYMSLQQYPKLVLGTHNIIHDHGNCHIMNETANFQVRNKNLIKDFKIIHIAYSDWIRIRVNGVQVLNTTGGDGDYRMSDNWHARAVHQFCRINSGLRSHTCNTKQFYTINPNTDLKPYLKDGDNTMQIELAFGNRGQLYIELVADQYCCKDWDITWANKCELQ